MQNIIIEKCKIYEKNRERRGINMSSNLYIIFKKMTSAITKLINGPLVTLVVNIEF